MMRRVLFVDDEPNILEGLRTRLRRRRNKWEMLFVSSGKAALEILSREPVDVIVSDMKMPEIDGATLLKTVQEQYPHVVRIVLSGYAEMETALRAVPVAHQFLVKPCEAAIIENVIERACNLQSLMTEDVVKRIVGKIDRLPSLPTIYSQLSVALTNGNVSTEGIARILRQDVLMCAKTLQIVNAAFLKLSRDIFKVEEAIEYLGFNTIKQIVLAVEVFQFTAYSAKSTLALDALRAHALMVANLASCMFTDKHQKEDAFVAGLLHDIGKLVLTVESPVYVDATQREMRKDDCPVFVAEQRLWGVTHAEIGAYLLGLWGLPYPIVEAVANHHAPSRIRATQFGVLGSTHVANAIIHGLTSEANTKTHADPQVLDQSFLKRLDVADRIDIWYQLAKRQVAADRK